MPTSSVVGSLAGVFKKSQTFFGKGWTKPKDFLTATKPGQRARKGASLGAVGGALVFAGFVGSRIKSGLSTPVDVLIGAALGFALVYLLGAALLLAVRLIRGLPTYLGFTGTGALLVFLFLLTGMRLPPQLFFVIGLGLVAALAVLGGTIGIATGPEFAGARTRKKIGTLVALVLAVAANVALGIWLMGAGTDADLVEFNPAIPSDFPTLDAPDPSQPGAYSVGTLFYGSGTDKHRIEFGEGVDLKTETVDAKPFVKDFKGWRKKARRWYWGFDVDEFPVNGRVWFPQGEGPFPLVLVVHGNHHMAEYSDPGYAYLGELLASRGFILVSVDENFLNGSFIGGIPTENDARGWMLLQHFKVWREWNETEGNPFYKKVDMENLGLIGHSRGGEAAAIAGAFNRLSRYPDDATVEFDFNFPIKAIIAIAPSDGQYRPANKRTPLENVNYFTIQGAHDSDVSVFAGDRQYNRVKFDDGTDWFKSSLYIYRANHGQFNTVWGRTDHSPPASWLLNLKPLLDGEEQRQIAKVYFTAFLEATLHGDQRYRPLFRDYRLARQWLPETVYINRYEDAHFRLVSDYEEDIDVTTTTAEGGRLSGENLAVWREQDIKLRGGSNRINNGVYLGWRPEEDQAEDKGEDEEGEKEPEDAAPSTASYTLSLPAGFARENRLTGNSRLVFNLSVADEKPPAPDKDKEDEDAEESEEDDREEETEKDEEPAKDEEKKEEPVDFTIELMGRDGTVARIPLSRFQTLPPALKVTFTKSKAMDKRRYRSASEPVLQTYELPLSVFVETEPRFRPAELKAVRFVFDRTEKGVIILDRIGVIR